MQEHGSEICVGADPLHEEKEKQPAQLPQPIISIFGPMQSTYYLGTVQAPASGVKSYRRMPRIDHLPNDTCSVPQYHLDCCLRVQASSWHF